MGNGVSMPTDKEQEIMNKRIEKLIASDKKRDLTLKKILLLGGSECGKSTLAKQIKILHCNGFSDAESEYFCLLSRQNIIESIALCIDRLDQMKFDYTADGSFADHVALIRKFCAQKEWASIEANVVGPILDEMWAHRFIKQSFTNVNNNNDNNSETVIPDNLFYFMGNIKRIFSADFKVNHDDILHARATTTGIVELDFSYRNLKFKLVDVGGQRSQRKKWIHCFDNVMAILFLVAMSEYDQFLAENTDVNRMHDSLQLFHSISNAVYFEKTPVVLFFNKKDIFEEKIPNRPLSLCFKDYKGENTFAMASEYMKTEFLKMKPEEKSIYSHFTNATDTKNIDLVFGATVDIILTKNMAKSGLN